MGRTRVRVDFTVEHDGDRMLPCFPILHFIERGLKVYDGRAVKIQAIEPGAKLVMSIASNPNIHVDVKTSDTHQLRKRKR